MDAHVRSAVVFSFQVGIFVLPSGRLGDIYGHKKMFMIGIAIFALFSLLLGFSVVSLCYLCLLSNQCSSSHPPYSMLADLFTLPSSEPFKACKSTTADLRACVLLLELTSALSPSSTEVQPSSTPTAWPSSDACTSPAFASALPLPPLLPCVASFFFLRN